MKKNGDIWISWITFISSKFPLVTPSFLDATHLTTTEVANDCNECGTSWECLNICLGAFYTKLAIH